MIFPSIDLLNGKVVQLRQGKDVVITDDNVSERAEEFSRFGVLGVVDLNAAFGEGSNDDCIKELCRQYECRVGGGIRTVERAREIVSWGASRIVVGSAAFTDSGVDTVFLDALSKSIGKERIAVAMDFRGNRIVVNGWRTETLIDPISAVAAIEPYAAELFVTCVDREGMEMGSDETFFSVLRRSTDMAITAAGGFSDTGSIERMTAIGINVQLGMALYTKRLSLEDAFMASVHFENCTSGRLVPVITCDETGQVLMTAYMNKESLKRTLATREMWYYSRSRQGLWKKGETSGNTQSVISLRTDCDGNAVLCTVRQKGSACHTLSYSCFGDRRYSLNELYDVIYDRFENPPEGSYTARLTDCMIKEKIAEEAQELIDAKTREEIIWEAADVLFFSLARCAKNGVTFNEVVNELRRRRRV